MFEPTGRYFILTQAGQSGWSAKRLTYAVSVVVIIGGALIIRAPAFWISSIDWDEGLYLVMAQQWLCSHLPYVVVWDQHPPGLPALFSMLQLMIPDPVLGARLAAVLAAIMTALLIHRFSVVYFRRDGAGLLAALLYIVCISRWLGLAANTEIFNNAIVTTAVYLLCGAALRPSHSLPQAMLAAFLLGLGLQIKYTILPESVLFCLAYLVILYRYHHDLSAVFAAAALLGLAGFLPTLTVILYFWSHGALQPFIDANFGSNMAYLQILPTLSAIAQSTGSGLAPVTGCMLITAYTMIHGYRWRTLPFSVRGPRAWLLLWSVASALNVCLPLKFFNHYYFALYPAFCLMGALALFRLARGRLAVFVTGMTILFVTAMPYLLIAEARAARVTKVDVPRAVAEALRLAGAHDMTVFVYDYNPVIYALAQVRPPTRFVLGAELNEYSHSAQVNGLSEVERIMDTSPDFIVQRERQVREGGWAVLDRLVTSRLAAYHVVYQIADREHGAIVRIYRHSAQQRVHP